MSGPSGDDARTLAGAALAAALRDSRATTLARTLDLDDAAWRMPEQRGVNPIAWELGHLAWFGELWTRRGPFALDRDGFVRAARPPSIAGPDAVFDSARLAHADRWRTPLPSRAATIDTLERQLDATIDAIDAMEDDDALYFHRLVLFHEDMHGEAFAWMRAALGLPAPPGVAPPRAVGDSPALRLAADDVDVGRTPADTGFSFDNELPGRRVRLGAFEIDSRPVTNREFAVFVDAGGYADERLWSVGSRARRTTIVGVGTDVGSAGVGVGMGMGVEVRRARGDAPPSHPLRWRGAEGGRWQARWFDRWLDLDLDAPVIHVDAHEAAAYCAFVGRRLPSAAEWERAAADPRFRWGASVWEWTADAFAPYPGFAPGPYRDYSMPWFGDHRELRGGSFATHARLHHPRYRNFFTAERSDVFAGFRTARSID